MTKNTIRIAALSSALARALVARRAQVLCAMASVAIMLLVLSGCSGGCSREKTPEPIHDRMQDSAYVDQLKERLDEQQELAVRRNQILRELEAARAEDPESEKTKELEKRNAEITVELEKQRIVNMAMIRERITKEQADRDKAAANTKEKK